MWFSLLLSKWVSRVLSRRSYGHTHVEIHYTTSPTVSSKNDFALGLTFLHILSFTVLDILLKATGRTWDFSLTFYSSQPTAFEIYNNHVMFLFVQYL